MQIVVKISFTTAHTVFNLIYNTNCELYFDEANILFGVLFYDSVRSAEAPIAT